MAFWRDSAISVAEQDTSSQTAVVVTNGLVIFNVLGDIKILDLEGECITPNGATASTFQFQANPTVGAAGTFSGASASLANAIAGTTVELDGTALSTAPNVYTNGVGLGQTSRGIAVPAGTISMVVGVGSTTGTWKFYIRYRPMEPGAIVTPAF